MVIYLFIFTYSQYLYELLEINWPYFKQFFAVFTQIHALTDRNAFERKALVTEEINKNVMPKNVRKEIKKHRCHKLQTAEEERGRNQKKMKQINFFTLIWNPLTPTLPT